MEKINTSQIENGDLLFLDGTATLAKMIKFGQKIRFPNGNHNFLNHAGMFVKDTHLKLAVLEQDYPGRLQMSSFIKEYMDEHKTVYVGKYKKPIHKNAIFNMIKRLKEMAGRDVFVNYSYSSYLGFAWDVIKFKLTGKPPKKFLLGIPKRTTVCSQIIAKVHMYENTGIYEGNWWEYYPVSLINDNVEIYKLEL